MSGGKWLSCHFNQSKQRFSVGTTNGFVVYDSETASEQYQANFDGGIQIAEILGSSNLSALVGSGKNPSFPTNKVVIWDNHMAHSIAEIECPAPITGVVFQLDKIIISLSDRVYIYDSSNMTVLKQLQTFPNLTKCASNGTSNNNTLGLAIPGDSRGSVILENYDPLRILNITAHQGNIRCMCLSTDGRYLATCSEKGTLIRVFSIPQTSNVAKQVFEFRRGQDPAEIYSMSFSRSATYLVVNSNTYKAHIFALARTELNTLSSWSGWGFSSYTESKWSAAQIGLPEVRSTVAFTSENSFVAIVPSNKAFHKFELDIDTTGAAPKLVVHKKGFTNLDQTDECY